MVDDNRRARGLPPFASALALSPVFRAGDDRFRPARRCIYYRRRCRMQASYCIASVPSGITDLRGLSGTPGVRIGATAGPRARIPSPRPQAVPLGGPFEIVVGFCGRAGDRPRPWWRGDIEAPLRGRAGNVNATGLGGRYRHRRRGWPISPRNEVEGVDFRVDHVTDPTCGRRGDGFASKRITIPMFQMGGRKHRPKVATLRAAFAAMVASPEFAA